MFEPRSHGVCGPLLGQSFCGWYCAPPAGGSFRRSAAYRGRAGPGVGVTANRFLTVAAPADGNRVLPSRAPEQAVSSRSRSAWLGGHFAQSCGRCL